MYGHKSAPAWILLIEAAQAWGVPPWKVAGGSKLLWFARFEAVRNANVKKAARMKKEAERTK